MKHKPIWRSHVFFLLASFGYWLLLSLLDRVAFALSIASKIENRTDIVYAFLYGFKLDLSLAGYLLALPFLFFIVQQLWIRRPVSPWILRLYVMLPTFILAAITVSNIPLYEAWGEKISKRALLMAIDTAGGVVNSVDAGMVVQGILLLVIFFGCAHYFYHLVLVPQAKYVRQTWQGTLIAFILGAVLIFSCIRGGYGRAAINQSFAYFSEDNVVNHVAVNTHWSFLKDLTKGTKKNPYRFGNQEDGHRLSPVRRHDSGLDSIHQVLNTDRPNVLLVILEGVVAQVFEDLGGEKEVTPRMTELMREGVNFTRAYAAADRSDKGMVALMSGFPAQGPESIIKYIPKHEKLPAIGQVFDSLGYATSFYHGGQSEFYNVKSYMLTHGIKRVVDNFNFPLNAKRTSWGVYDHVVADRMLHDLNNGKEPFFSIFYTLVNHEPFDLSPSYQFGNDTKADAYRSTSFYTDSMLFNFIERAKQQDWYEHTVVLVTSDHGHHYPTEKYGLERPERYHIPLFVFGGALKPEWRGKKIQRVVSQLDVAKTLAHFVSVPTGDFPYSQDLFAKNRMHTAFFNSNTTFGLVNQYYSVSYDLLRNDIAYSTVPDVDVPLKDSLMNVAKDYYKEVFDAFLAY